MDKPTIIIYTENGKFKEVICSASYKEVLVVNTTKSKDHYKSDTVSITQVVPSFSNFITERVSKAHASIREFIVDLRTPF